MSRLASESLDRDLDRWERIALQSHLLYCQACRHFSRQIVHLRRAAAPGHDPDRDRAGPARYRHAGRRSRPDQAGTPGKLTGSDLARDSATKDVRNRGLDRLTNAVLSKPRFVGVTRSSPGRTRRSTATKPSPLFFPGSVIAGGVEFRSFVFPGSGTCQGAPLTMVDNATMAWSVRRWPGDPSAVCCNSPAHCFS